MVKILFAVFVVLAAMVGWRYWSPKDPGAFAPAGTESPAGGALSELAGGQTNAAQNALNRLTEGATPVKTPAPEFKSRSMSRGLPTEGDWRGHPALGDVNGDGNVDLVASIRRYDSQTPGEGVHVWLGDGGESWTPANQGLRRDMGYGGADLGDVDGDGKVDLAFSGHDVPPHIFINFLDQESAAWVSTTPDGLPIDVVGADVALGDFNRDGHVDIATLGQFPQRAGLKVFLGDGTGSMAESEPLELMKKNFYGAQVRMTDLDGDGHVEVLAATALGPKVWFFEDAVVDRSAGLPTPEVGGTDLAIDAADLDGDGFKELLVGGGFYRDHPGLRIYRWDGSTWGDWGTGLPADESYLDCEFVDFIPGGPAEIVGAGKWGIGLVKMTSPGVFERIGRLEGTEGIWHMTSGDVDHDGVPEIVTVGYGGVRVLEPLLDQPADVKPTVKTDEKPRPK